MAKVLILGGAGFLGSNIAKRFVESGDKVHIIDSLADKTGGKRENLRDIIFDITFTNSDITGIDNLNEIIEQSDIIIDCMAWTAHRSAISNPRYDLKLNVESHLSLINALKGVPNVKDKKIIYLGTKVQYGSPYVEEITEETPMVPEDIQGIHKLVSESHFRVYSKLNELNVVSLRLPNCFGENQPIEGEDIGLIGGFIRDILNGKEIELFGENRKRYLLYAKDLAEIVFRLSQKPFKGFSAFNVGGKETKIEDLAKNLIEIIGQGIYIKKEIPFEVKSIDPGNAKFSDEKLRRFLGEIPETDLKLALKETVQYFKENLK